MHSLAWKLMLAFLVISLTGAALASLFARWITVREFDRLVLEQAENSFMSEVTAYYQAHGSWAGVTEYFRQRAESRQTSPQEPGKPPARPPENAGGAPQPAGDAQQPPQVPVILIDRDGTVLHPVPPYRLGDIVPPALLVQGKPVKIGDQVVGTILATGAPPPLDAREQQYLERTNLALLVSTLGAVAIALLMSLFLARTLTHPIRDLAGAIRAMAQGKLGIVVPVRSRDEIGELTAAFNQMSADIARSNQLRRQMTADIAHDLRTPLTVVGGYIESLRDGVLEPTPARLDAMQHEVQQLLHLVEDLRTLSLADAGELKLDCQPIAPHLLLEQAATAFKHQAEQKQITLCVVAEPNLPHIAADELRIGQVLGNLVSNALRYTPAGGQITLGAATNGEEVLLTVRDNGAGITPEDLPYVFDRFYRADASRQQPNSESGLGLAIAKSLVELHGGTLTAASAPGTGAMLTIVLPMAHY